jgi:fatty-acyl-CoA synthase
MSVMGNYASVVLDRLTGIGDGDAVVFGDRRISGTDAAGTVLRYAAVLREVGLRTGDGVAVFVGNSPEGLFLQVAAHFVGCRLVFVPPEPGNSELGAFLRRAEVKALFYDPALADRAREIVAEVAVPQVFGIAELARDRAGLAPEDVADERDVTTLMYTGGTTGMPKLVTRTHSFYQGMVVGAVATAGVPKVLVCTLITHTSGHTGALSGLLRGATVVLMETFDAGTALSIMDRERIAMVGVVPPMLYQLLDHPGWPAGGFPALQVIFYTGAAAAPSRLAEAIRRFGPVLLQAYGSTEAGLVTVLMPEEHLSRLTSCGRPVPGVEVELRDADGHPVARGEVGEIHVRGPMVMDGYWKDPERTAEVLDGDGWYHTGDLARQDDDGYFYLVGRVRDIIVTGDTADNVYSRLLDDFLISLPDVRDAAAIGLPGKDDREDVHVVLVPRDPAAVPDLSLLTRKVVDALGDLYAPTGYTIAESLPHTTVGKTDKRALRSALLR